MKRVALNWVWTLVLVMLFCGTEREVYGQVRSYATWTPTSGHIQAGLLGGTGGVTDASKAKTSLETEFAIMKADRVSVLAGRDAYLQLKFPTNREAGSTTFVKISKPILEGLNLSLTQILGLAGNNIIGEFFIGAADNAGSAGTPVTTIVKTRIIIDAVGDYYLSITPETNVEYNSVKITITYPSGLLNLGNLKMNVYYGFTLTGTICSTSPSFTNLGEATGVNLDLLGLSQLIANPQYAISNNSNEYASYSSGVLNLGVASTISQTIYFDHVTSVQDAVKVRLGLSNSLIGLGVGKLNAIKFIAYKGVSEIPVWSGGLETIAQLLGLDLLNLINLGGTHKEVNITFKLNTEFDRIKIEYDAGLLNLGVIGDALRVYNMSLAPAAPLIVDTGQPHDVQACAGENAILDVTATPAGGTSLTYQWQVNNSGSWVNIGATSSSSSFTLSSVQISDNTNRYRVIVTGGNAGCLQTITSEEAWLTVLPLPKNPSLSIQNTFD